MHHIYKFDHDQEDFFESVGLTSKKKSLVEFISYGHKKYDSASEVLEYIMNSDLGDHEKVICAFMFGRITEGLKRAAMMKVIRKIIEDLDE